MGEQTNNTEENENIDALYREIDMLNDAAREANRVVDRTLLSFSGGAFVLSVSFLQRFSVGAWLHFLLVISWVLFALSIIVGLYGQRFSEKVIQAQREIVHARIQKNDNDRRAKEERWKKLSDKMVSINARAFGIFITGLVVLVVFAALGLRMDSRAKIYEKEKSLMNANKKTPDGTPVVEGFVGTPQTPLHADVEVQKGFVGTSQTPSSLEPGNQRGFVGTPQTPSPADSTASSSDGDTDKK